MKIYVAIGGIGCSILKTFQEKEHINNEFCYYIDTDYNKIDYKSVYNDDLNNYHLCLAPEKATNGFGGLRNIGRVVVKYNILSNRMNEFFKPLREISDSDIELIFVTTSFGGTGSVAVFEIAEYLQALLWMPRNNKCKDCLIVAFNYHCFSYMNDFPKKTKELFDMNTIQTVMEASTKTNLSVDAKIIDKVNASIFNPFYELVLIDEPIYEFSELYRVLSFNKSKLALLDKKNQYMEKQKPSIPEVFISYSSKDQNIANLIVYALNDKGINSWIASKNITQGSYAKQIIQGINGAKIFVVLLSRNSVCSQHVKNEIDRAFARLNDGLIMVPFIIEECELDEDYQYYLCRQEILDGSQPPIEQRINDVVITIKNLLD